jgi:hypothetical protein
MFRLERSFQNGYKNPYQIGDNVEFYNKYGKWIKGFIIGFKINDYVYKAIIKCYENNCCKFHYVCVCSKYLRKDNYA